MVRVELRLPVAGARMIEVGFTKRGEPLRVLCLGAHSDDIEIGCGGAVLELAERKPAASFTWVVLSAAGVRGTEARAGAARMTRGCETDLHLKEFRDGFLPCHAAQVKEFFEELKGQVSPDVILTHWQGDAHQDHRLVSELTWNTFRNHVVLEYEIPKYDGDMGRPNIFVPLEHARCARKLEVLNEVFATQRPKPWFAPETFLGLMRLRGMECNSPSGYAEAFYARKAALNLAL